MVIPTQYMTVPEFFALPESTLPIELIHGEVIVSPTPIPQHQRLIGRLYMLLNRLIPNGEVFIAPLDVYIEVWRRQDDHFVLLGVFGPGETFEAFVLGKQTIDTNEIFTG